MALNERAQTSGAGRIKRVKVPVRTNLGTRVLVLLDQECTVGRLEGTINRSIPTALPEDLECETSQLTTGRPHF